MTVSSQTLAFEYAANGVTTTFAYGFKVIYSEQVKVYVDGVIQVGGYSLTGVGDAAGGNVIFSSAPASGTVVLVRRISDRVRTTDFQQAPYFTQEELLDLDQDYQTMLLQEAAADAANSLRIPAVETNNTLLPVAADRANKFLQFTGTGDVALSDGTGNNPTTYYAATKSAADTLAASLPDGATVIVDRDEDATPVGVQTRRTVSGGALSAIASFLKASMIAFTQAGVGAVARTLNAKGLEIVTQADFGGTATPVLVHKVTNASTNGPNVTIGGLNTGAAISSDVSNSVILNPGSTGYNNIVGGDGALTVDTVTPNVVITGTGANVSVVGGYDCVAGQLSSKIISDHSYTEYGTGTSQGHNAIYGGAGHVIKESANFSMIGGGKDIIVGGAGSFATGITNVANGIGSFVSGALTTVSGNYSAAHGTGHTVSGVGCWAHGSINTAAQNFSSATGNFSHARFVGQQAHTAGRFAVTGDAQTSVLQMHRATTDATTVTLGMLGGNTAYQLQPNQSGIFKVQLVAREVGSTNTAAWEITAAYSRGATGSPVAIGTATVTAIGASAGAATWVAGITTDSIGGINVRITGEVGKTIRWVQRFTAAEVTV